MSLFEAHELMLGGVTRLRRVSDVPPLMRGRFAWVLSHQTDKEGRETCLIRLWTWNETRNVTVPTNWLLAEPPDVAARLDYLERHSYVAPQHQGDYVAWHRLLDEFLDTLAKLVPIQRYNLDDIWTAFGTDSILRALHLFRTGVPSEMQEKLEAQWDGLLQAAQAHLRPMEEDLLNDE